MTRAAVLTLALLAALPAAADERHFTYSYEAQTLPKGVFEFEQWATLRARKEAGVFRTTIFSEEFEYGVTDDLTTALYLNWEFEAIRGVPDLENKHEVEFESVSSGWKYRLTNPALDPVGLLLYGEVSAGDDEAELEAKLIVNKIVGPWHLVYNFVFEAEREKEDGEWESEFVLSNTIGVSLAVAPGVHVGLEALNHLEFEHGLSESEHNAYFVGPNAHVASGRWWATLTVLRQVDLSNSRGLELDEHEKYEARIIVGFTF